MLAAAGLAGRFAVEVTGDDVDERKPHPAGLLNACARLAVAPALTVYVGDAHVDLACATAAGATGIHAAWAPRPPTAAKAHHLAANEPIELLPLIDALLPGPRQGAVPALTQQEG